MVWAWFIVLLATLPGLWVADLLTDSLAGNNLVVFISGAAIALLVFVPLALIQDAAMDRTGLPPALESP